MLTDERAQFVSLGLFIIDEFEFRDEDGKPTGRAQRSQIGGGGTYAVLGARIWLPPRKIGMVIDRGYDFPGEIREKLLEYGEAMWLFRDQPQCQTTRALNLYKGEHRDFKYLTDRIRLTPRDIAGTKLERPHLLHFICSPRRAKDILAEVEEVAGWNPTVIYEPIPDSCIPESLPALKEILPFVDILSPNAEEALNLLAVPLPPTKLTIEEAAHAFLKYGVSQGEQGAVVIRSGELGAFVIAQGKAGLWVDAFWDGNKDGAGHVVDVTGAGNSFLGGLAAGLVLAEGDVYEATLYAAISASFTIEQEGLPVTTPNPQDPDWPNWNGDSPRRRLRDLRARLGK